jgi:hypothetical protein
MSSAPEELLSLCQRGLYSKMDRPFKVSKTVQAIFDRLMTAVRALITCVFLGLGLFPWLMVIRLATAHFSYFSEETWQEIKTQVMQGFYLIAAVVLVTSVVIYHFARTRDFMEYTKKTISETIFKSVNFVLAFQAVAFLLGISMFFGLMILWPQAEGVRNTEEVTNAMGLGSWGPLIVEAVQVAIGWGFLQLGFSVDRGYVSRRIKGSTRAWLSWPCYGVAVIFFLNAAVSTNRWGLFDPIVLWLSSWF